MPKSRTFFSMADMRFNQEPNASHRFKEALVHNVLFRWEKLLVPDVFFFGSSHIRDLMGGSEPHKSFFAQCVAKGYITPVFRRGATDFGSALREIKSHAGKGIEWDEAQRIASGLDLAIQEANRGGSWEAWPEADMGVLFLEKLRSLFDSEEAPRVIERIGIVQSEFDSIWEKTRKWRTDTLAGAIEATEKKGREGVQRGEIMTAFAEALGGQYSPDDEEILRPVRDDAAKYQAAQAFMNWIKSVYLLNQAQAFGGDPNLYTLNEETASLVGPVVATVLGEGGDAEVAVGSAGVFPEDAPCFVHQIRVPTLDVLLNIDPATLFDIRFNYGGEYLMALEAWRTSPSEEAASKMRDALTRYAEELEAKVMFSDRRMCLQIEQQVSPINRERIRSAIQAFVKFANWRERISGGHDSIKLLRSFVPSHSPMGTTEIRHRAHSTVTLPLSVKPDEGDAKH